MFRGQFGATDLGSQLSFWLNHWRLILHININDIRPANSRKELHFLSPWCMWEESVGIFSDLTKFFQYLYHLGTPKYLLECYGDILLKKTIKIIDLTVLIIGRFPKMQPQLLKCWSLIRFPVMIKQNTAKMFLQNTSGLECHLPFFAAAREGGDTCFLWCLDFILWALGGP